jgi:opacity protein-like surface antigen
MSLVSKLGLGALAVALSASAALAQDPAATGGSASEGRIQASVHLSQAFNDDDTAEGGVGGRLMIAAPQGAALGIFSRPAIGAYVNYANESVSISGVDADLNLLSVGGELDLRLFGGPVINNRVDPFISLGAGLLRASGSVSGGGIDEDDSSNFFSFIPGLGANFIIQQGMSISARGDLGYQIVTGDGSDLGGPIAQLGLAFAF